MLVGINKKENISYHHALQLDSAVYFPMLHWMQAGANFPQGKQCGLLVDVFRRG